MLYPDIINEIQKYTNILNLNDFIEEKEDIKYKCDSCNSIFYNSSQNNIISYKILDFDIINSLEDITYPPFIHIKKTTYEKHNNVFCDYCIYMLNKRLKLYNYSSFGITNYITKTHFDDIIKNNFTINLDNNIHLNRYNYKIEGDKLIVNSIFIYSTSQRLYFNNYKKKFFYKYKMYLCDNFNIDLFTLNKYIK